MENVKEIKIKLILVDYCFTAGWLQKFKVCLRIPCQVVCGESIDVPADFVTE